MEDQYTITIFWSDEDEAFIAVVLELEGCSAWGETREDALREIKIAMQGWLETARSHGIAIPEPSRHRAVANM
jgi:predicted RNase H-like HicB family nuclease